MRKVNSRCNDFIKNVDFEKLNEILKRKHLTKAEISRKCGYYNGYIGDHVFREKRLNKNVANTLENVYGILPGEYTYKETEKSTSNDGQLALRLDKDLIEKFRSWAFYNRLSQKDAMEKILSEYLDGKKTATTAGNDDITEELYEFSDIEDYDDDIYEFTIKLNGKLLKELALKSVIYHISVEDFVRDCVVKGISKGRKTK